MSSNVPPYPSPPPPPPQVPPEAQPYEGLGGWLILVAFGLIITPIRLGATLVTTFLPLFSPEKWQKFVSPDSPYYHPLMGPLIIGETCINAFFALLCVVLLILFFLKKRFFPVVTIFYLASNLALLAADYFVGQQIPLVAQENSSAAYQEIARSAVACCIWIPYMLVSKRVKATFTR